MEDVQIQNDFRSGHMSWDDLPAMVKLSVAFAALGAAVERWPVVSLAIYDLIKDKAA